MADQFEIIEAKPKLLTVRHLAEEHLYAFHVVEDRDGRLILGHDNEYARAEHSGAHHFFEAREFAEAEARRRRMIDC
ncbi:hypothetical protein SAMN05519103_08788 [Rhizobiales bacterium GAS113]|nr:hypothetical protein SAMN05519103_08788 [Rhizobiales bacterium GAS113]SEF04014.1 hypothetical protein SAMN05519104_8032 [Rhizobiales bacterium GAS188]